MRCWLVLLCLPSLLHAADLWMKVGGVRVLAAPTGKAVRIGSRGVIKVIDGEKSVRVVALKPGVTPLVIGEVNHTVHVSASQQVEFVNALRTHMQGIMGLHLELNAQPPAVTGTLFRFSDWLAISDLARAHQGEYVFKAHALPDVARQALTYLQSLAREKGYPILHFRAAGGFTAEIPKAAESLQDGASRLFQPFGIRVESTESNLLLEPLIRTRVILAELSKSEALDFGIQWPAEYQAQVLPKFSGEGGLLATLHALEARGKAQILASPNLLCKSGGEAKFHAGGSFPIRIFNRYAHDIVWKEHGVLLSVQPQADFQGAISLQIETEVSLLDSANAVEGVPALKTNTVKSHFDLPGKRTITLSGLLRQELGEDSEGLPYLKRIPILGALFSSQRFVKRQSELVIFVTPEIYVPDSDEPLEMPQGWVRDGV